MAEIFKTNTPSNLGPGQRNAARDRHPGRSSSAAASSFRAPGAASSGPALGIRCAPAAISWRLIAVDVESEPQSQQHLILITTGDGRDFSIWLEFLVIHTCTIIWPYIYSFQFLLDARLTSNP
ncbi:hypothetical protein AAY473_016474 [Plecturocebus cupreus]